MNLFSSYHWITTFYGRTSKNFSRRFAFPPLHIIINITNLCNAHCEYCQLKRIIRQVSGPVQPPSGEISIRDIRRLLTSMRWTPLVTFTGGEPFVREDFFEILKEACKTHLCSVETNGTLLNRSLTEKLCRLTSRSPLGKGLFDLQFTLAGVGNRHDARVGLQDAFHRMMEGIETIIELKKTRTHRVPRIVLRFLLDPTNTDDLPAAVELAQKWSCNLIIKLRTYQELDFSFHHSLKEFELSSPPKKILIESEVQALRNTLQYLRTLPLQIRRSISFIPVGIGEANLIGYFDQASPIKDVECLQPWLRLVITPEKHLAFCSEMRLGHLDEGDPALIWNGETARRARARIKNELSPYCDGCCFLAFR